MGLHPEEDRETFGDTGSSLSASLDRLGERLLAAEAVVRAATRVSDAWVRHSCEADHGAEMELAVTALDKRIEGYLRAAAIQPLCPNGEPIVADAKT